MMSRSRFLLLLGAALLWMCQGCGSDRPGTVPVQGTVLYRGKAVEGARVMFMATGAQAPAASGETNAQGHFTLMTFEPGDGAIAGQYKVLITKRQESPDPKQPDSPYKITRDLLPARYGNPTRTDLTAEVTPGGPNDFSFELKD